MLRMLLCVAICTTGFYCMPSVTAHPPVRAYQYYGAAYHSSYHQQVQRLDARIRLQVAQIESLERTLAEWESLDRFRHSRVLGVDIERTQLLLAEAKFGLECLEQQKFDLVRSRARGW